MQRGLGLIELLIVVALIGMLATIAYPSYSDQLRRAARGEVVGLLQDAALRLEQHRSYVGGYADTEQLVTVLSAGSRYYRLQAQRDEDAFTLLARRVTETFMAGDRCGDFRLDHAGVRDNPGGSEDEQTCWGS
ncbi:MULTISPECIES: type IV pilin protein [unclassified Pseudomonas]|uniref:type IV pilin protein n=1 Tax=unclassified Pseudomonas TaxID=196821 RepID=UPI000C87FBA3|nr:MULTISPECIES: type IV pilin protein [unclassified Pseudomonas]PNA01958.1 pilus assembly protein PilE [Pseudomonas sp. FW305-42]PNA26160.1 pilus assembly protein PilE [Pseudomonas sp. MPR-R1B]PNB27319.1 pilus assembly protein PilE [Pseudomonas sp. DP16D-E2]PNB42633.1 pilus assembly protein PilE [Pseudomonas sp. FW305-17]PNB62580.1 pilus assembly protein PilE [Pseudomonas sp. GW531-E2]